MRRGTAVVLVLGLVVALVVPSFGQVAISKGIKGGINFANLGGSDVEDTDSRTAFNVGVFAGIQLANILYLQPEVLYTMKGATQKFDFQGTTIKTTVKLTYLEIPVLFRLNVPVQGSNVAPNFFAGPALAFKLSAKAKAEGGGQSAEEDIEEVKSTDFSLVFGAGLGVGPVSFDVRYSLGLSSIDDSAENADVKNNVISINGAFSF